MSAVTHVLSDLKGVGPATLRGFAVLGISSVPQLAACDGQKLYDRLCEITQQRHDPCCLDVLHCTIAQARDPKLPSGQRKWWHGSQVRKGQAAARHA